MGLVSPFIDIYILYYTTIVTTYSLQTVAFRVPSNTKGSMKKSTKAILVNFTPMHLMGSGWSLKQFTPSWKMTLPASRMIAVLTSSNKICSEVIWCQLLWMRPTFEESLLVFISFAAEPLIHTIDSSCITKIQISILSVHNRAIVIHNVVLIYTYL